MMPTNDSPVTRAEFEATMRRIENVLEQQTKILQQLAVGEVENRQRDALLAETRRETVELRERLEEQRQQHARWSGGLAVLVGAWPLLAKKLGLT